MIIELEYNKFVKKEGFDSIKKSVLIRISEEIQELIKETGPDPIVKATSSLKKYPLKLEYIQKAKINDVSVIIVDTEDAINWMID